MQTPTKTYIKFIDFKDFRLWDVKRYSAKQIYSSFSIVALGKYIQAEHRKYKLFLEPENDFGILGVNNVDGIFDAYTQKGKEINQAYKKMQTGWIAYNPYRVNVGSIGIKKTEHKNEYISPAYVVFSCKENLLPEFLFLVFKTKTFNQVINDNTTGSVRQNLTIDILKSLQISLPPISEQQKIVKSYFEKINRAKELEKEAQNIEQEIEEYFLAELGIEKTEKRERKKGLQFVEFSTLTKWGIDFVHRNTNIQPIYKEYAINKLCKISSGGTPSRNKKEFFENGYIPWIKTGELNNDILMDTEEKITDEALKNSSAKLYKKGSLVVAMYGATIGKTAKLGIDATTNQACAVMFNIDNSKIITDYLWEYLQVRVEHLKTLAYGSAQPNLNAGIISNYTIPLPNLPKQQEIVNVIQTKKDALQKLKEQAKTLKHQAETEFEQTVFKRQSDKN